MATRRRTGPRSLTLAARAPERFQAVPRDLQRQARRVLELAEAAGLIELEARRCGLYWRRRGVLDLIGAP